MNNRFRPPESRRSDTIRSPVTEPRPSANQSIAVLSFSMFDAGIECPSLWRGQENKKLFATFAKITKRTWQQIIETSGTAYADKVGLGYTEFKTNDPIPRPVGLSPDIPISEMRVDDHARIFGARKESTYFVICLRRKHAK